MRLSSISDSVSNPVLSAWETIQALGQSPETLSANWCISPESGRFLHVLTRSINAKRMIEVGTSIGFSTLHLALGVFENIQDQHPPNIAEIISIDASAERQAIAKTHFEQAGLSSLITLRTGDGIETLTKLREELTPRSLDLAFIDARKSEYIDYLALLTPIIRPGGLLIADNTQSHREEMLPFINAMLEIDRQGEKLWDTTDINTPSGMILARKRA